MNTQPNEGNIDRALRVVFGIASAGIAYTSLSGPIQIAAYLLGGVLIATGITGVCLFYTLLGIRTGGTVTQKK